MPKMYLKIHIQ